MGIPDHLTCLLRNLYAGQEATVRKGHETTDWFQIGKAVCQGCILSPCLFNFYAEYIMWNAGLDEAQAGNKISRRNVNNLRYADDTTLMAESKEELKSLFLKVEEESFKARLKVTIQSWNSNTLATWWEELIHWKRSWFWERLKMGEEGDDRGWDGWMASLTQWIHVWVNSGSWW